MMFAVPAESYELDPEIERTLELLLILHADHEQNCSTSTVRVVGSSMANVYASVASGILALWGPLHGGANQQVVFESLLLVLPIIIPMFTVLTTSNPSDFIAAFLAYLVIGTVVSLSRVVIGAGVGAFGKVLYFFFAYMMALMVYAGCVAGAITGETFSLLLAFDQIAGIATYLGYEGHPIELPLIEYVKLGMAFAIPGITFSALAAQVRLSEVRDNPGAESKMVSSLRSSVALLTLGSAILLLPVYIISIAIVNFAPYLVTIIPPVLVMGFILLVLYFVERD